MQLRLLLLLFTFVGAETPLSSSSQILPSCSTHWLSGYRIAATQAHKTISNVSLKDCESECVGAVGQCAAFAYGNNSTCELALSSYHRTSRNVNTTSPSSSSSKPTVEKNHNYAVYLVHREHCRSYLIDNKQQDCFYRLMSGKRLQKQQSLRAISVQTLQECQDGCIRETSFQCRSVSYRYMPSGYSYSVSNCELSPYYMERNSHQDRTAFLDDFDYDFFQRESYCNGGGGGGFGGGSSGGMMPSSSHWSVCSAVVRRGGLITPNLARGSQMVSSPSQCEHLCATTALFRCRAFAFRHTDRGRVTHHNNRENCHLYENELGRLQGYAVENDQDFDLFEMGRLDNQQVCVLQHQQNRNNYNNDYNQGGRYRPVTHQPPSYNNYYDRPQDREIYDHNNNRGGGSSVMSSNSNLLPGEKHNYYHHPPLSIRPEEEGDRHHHGHLKPEQNRDYYYDRRYNNNNDNSNNWMVLGQNEKDRHHHHDSSYRPIVYEDDKSSKFPLVPSSITSSSSAAASSGVGGESSSGGMCLLHSNSYLQPDLARATFPTKSLEECRVECQRSMEVLRFRCSIFSYRYPTPTSSTGNNNMGTCQLSDTPPSSLRPTTDLIPLRDSVVYSIQECVGRDREYYDNRYPQPSNSYYGGGGGGGYNNRYEGNYNNYGGGGGDGRYNRERYDSNNNQYYPMGGGGGGDRYHNRERYEGNSNHFTVDGERCMHSCMRNRDAGFYYCQIDREGAWNFCCRPDDGECGYSRGLSFAWCYVGTGPSRDIWRMCKNKRTPNYSNYDHRQPSVQYIHSDSPPPQTTVLLTNNNLTSSSDHSSLGRLTVEGVADVLLNNHNETVT